MRLGRTTIDQSRRYICTTKIKFFFSDILLLVFTTPPCLTKPAIVYKVAPTSFAQASVLKDLGRSIGAPTARSIINCGRTPMARETPKRTV